MKQANKNHLIVLISAIIIGVDGAFWCIYSVIKGVSLLSFIGLLLGDSDSVGIYEYGIMLGLVRIAMAASGYDTYKEAASGIRRFDGWGGWKGYSIPYICGSAVIGFGALIFPFNPNNSEQINRIWIIIDATVCLTLSILIVNEIRKECRKM